MKYYFTVFASLFLFYSGWSQNELNPNVLTNLLSSYYNMKNSLVAGNQQSASQNALAFLRTANTIDYKIISEGNINIIVSQATKINEATTIEDQRNYFSSLSTNMIAIAKAFRPGKEPIYEVYCPMKKASWLSRDKKIENPYYGSAMMNCGEVKEVINP